MKVSIVYWSGTGNTEAMANAVAEGAKNTGAEVELLPVSAASADVIGSDALLFGCPAMGSEELEESEFEPFFSSVEGSLSGKKVGLFGSYDWGDGEWMRTWQQRVVAAGGVMIEDGLICNNAPDDEPSCRLPRARRKSGKVREYAQNHIGSRGDALRNVRNARQ
ncbi:MAG: flavodoxin [Candidatus Amulumruptor caecigallinarius]|nr:MAG: flavodoxin [Candidatus Amulumruptor caecigallinarius]